MPDAEWPTIWQAWLGSRPLPGDLAAAHQTVLNRAGRLRVRLLRDADIPAVLPEVAAHPMFPHLPPLQRSEFVRAALMHHYGGVWLDTDAIVIAGNLGDELHGCVATDQPGHQAVIGPLRPNTTFTSMWLSGVTDALARHREDIMQTAQVSSRRVSSRRGGRLGLSATGLQGDCGMSAAECGARGRKGLPWEFVLGDVWNDIAARLGMHGYDSMSCDYQNTHQCLGCCPSHWAESIGCNGRSGAFGVQDASDPIARMPSAHRPRLCTHRRVPLRNENGSVVLTSVPAAHVMLTLSSSIPQPVKALDRDTFLRSSSSLARYARGLLGMRASATTREAIERREGCVANFSALPKELSARDALLTRVLPIL